MTRTVARPGKSEKPWALINLPPFPAVAMRVLQLIDKDDVGIQKLTDLIRADLALSTEILTLANSALYAFRTEIKSILQAAVLLGLQRVKALAITVGMRVYLTDSMKIPALLACWRHSLASALLAEDLAIGNFVDKDSAYTAALLHDIGRLALAVIQPAKYADFLKSTEDEPCDVLERERELFEIDHCQAGRWLVEAWKLPRTFADVTAHHHTQPNNRIPEIVALVRHSCLLADALGFAAVRSLAAPSYQDILEELSVRERRRFPQDPEELSIKIATKINSME
jgi:putative nucleotidyltransferase with HDIG domain